MDGFTERIFLRWLPWILRMNSNIVAKKGVALTSERAIDDDTITVHFKRTGYVETVVTYSTHANKIVTQQWSCVAAVVDRCCLVFSVIVTVVSVTVFLVYAY